MVVEKIYVNNATRLSLSDRFTILQSVQPGLPPRRPRNQNPFEDGQTSTLRSSSLMNRLGLTPMARAAMEIKKVPLKQRIGKIRPRAPNSQSLFRNGAPLMSPGRGRGRGAQRRSRSFSSIARGRRRSNSIGNLNRSSSFSDASSGTENQVYDRPLRVRRRGRGGFRFNGQTRNTTMQRGGVRRWRSGRGGGRGRGRGRGSGRGNGNRGGHSVPSKEDLDRELDQYMAGSKAHLDQELDSYMVNAMDTSN